MYITEYIFDDIADLTAEKQLLIPVSEAVLQLMGLPDESD